jgi:hypothetical protein
MGQDDEEFSRYSRRGGYAWLSPSFTFPHGWQVSIPTGTYNWIDVAVGSLDEALEVVAERGLRLDVDDWTYARMVEDGVAPLERPTGAHLPPGRYPGTGLRTEDWRPMSWSVLQHAPDFIGLTKLEANRLATERDLDARIYDEDDYVRTADYRPSRLNLELRGGRVVAASVG